MSMFGSVPPIALSPSPIPPPAPATTFSSPQISLSTPPVSQAEGLDLAGLRFALGGTSLPGAAQQEDPRKNDFMKKLMLMMGVGALNGVAQEGANQIRKKGKVSQQRASAAPMDMMTMMALASIMGKGQQGFGGGLGANYQPR